MARKIFLSSGHGGTDTGAVANGYIERDLAIEFRKLITQQLNLLGINPIEDPDSNALAQALAWYRGKFGVQDIMVDLHWNAGMADAKGTEVIVPETSTNFERALAADVLKVYSGLGFSQRGIIVPSQTPRGHLGWERQNAQCILIESCFITNVMDMKLYQANKYTLAKQLAILLRNYSNIK